MIDPAPRGSNIASMMRECKTQLGTTVFGQCSGSTAASAKVTKRGMTLDGLGYYIISRACTQGYIWHCICRALLGGSAQSLR